MSDPLKSVLKQQLERLVTDNSHLLLKEVQHGIEKEGLRVDSFGTLSQEKHPEGLGSALTNSYITTDFSESQLELITPVFKAPEDAIDFLANLHSFTYHHLGDELIWAGSMPCRIEDPASIPIARYGSSNIGRMKHIYRIGLDYRYGRVMQSIAGIHYNFSLPHDFWRHLQGQQKNDESLHTFQSASYFHMIRNFRRYSWLLLYLFGASPALCASFLKEKTHELETLQDQTLYLPFATSLRMSDLGYSTTAQSSLDICFNKLETYIGSLEKAITTPYPPYEKIGIKVDGAYRQLNDSILQIENEYYSDIRPKRVIQSAERHLQALRRRGVEYVEVRHTDVNPFLPVGIDSQQARFIDIFLISCLLMDSDKICPAECKTVSENMQRVITRGRQPGLSLTTAQGEIGLAVAGRELLDTFRLTAEVMDQVHETDKYRKAVQAQVEKINNPASTPSAQVVEALQETGLNYTEWIVLKSREHRKTFRQLSPDSPLQRELASRAARSLEEQKRLESDDSLGFDQFLKEYLNP